MSKLSVVKATLSTGKIVYLREMKIGHTERAAQAASQRANGDANVLQLGMQQELVKLLLVAIQQSADSPRQELTAAQREDLDSLFSLPEYAQVLKVLGKMSGGDQMGKEPVLELASEA